MPLYICNTSTLTVHNLLVVLAAFPFMLKTPDSTDTNNFLSQLNQINAANWNRMYLIEGLIKVRHHLFTSKYKIKNGNHFLCLQFLFKFLHAQHVSSKTIYNVDYTSKLDI